MHFNTVRRECNLAIRPRHTFEIQGVTAATVRPVSMFSSFSSFCATCALFSRSGFSRRTCSQSALALKYSFSVFVESCLQTNFSERDVFEVAYHAFPARFAALRCASPSFRPFSLMLLRSEESFTPQLIFRSYFDHQALCTTATRRSCHNEVIFVRLCSVLRLHYASGKYSTSQVYFFRLFIALRLPYDHLVPSSPEVFLLRPPQLICLCICSNSSTS